MKESTKDWVRNIVTMGYGVFVLNLPRIMPQIVPNEISLTVVQVIGGVALGQGFINIISSLFGIDSNRSVLNKLDKQDAHIQALEDKLTAANTLLQQLIDKANHPTINVLPPINNPANIPTSSKQTMTIHDGH